MRLGVPRNGIAVLLDGLTQREVLSAVLDTERCCA